MADEIVRDFAGQIESPGGFVFGVQGWTWGPQRPMSITFFLNGTCRVSDQHGRVIKGTVRDNKPLFFDKCTHAQVVAALVEERVDWQSLICAGWPQLPYEQLKSMRVMPPWPFAEAHVAGLSVGQTCTCVSCSIRDEKLRKDALRVRREAEDARQMEVAAASEE